MERKMISFATAALMASALTAPVFAGNIGVGGKVDAGVNAGVNAGTAGTAGAAGGANAQVQTDTSTTSSTASRTDFNSMISAMGAGSSSASAIQNMGNVSSVTIIKVRNLKGSNKQALKAALAKNKSDIASLQAALEANAGLKAKLSEKSVKPTNVVAAQVGADGALTVFVE